MAKHWKKITACIGTIAGIIDFFGKQYVWGLLKAAAGASWTFLSTPYLLPLWALILLFLTGPVCLLVLYFRRPTPLPPSIIDSFFDLDWIWDRESPWDSSPLCPNCGLEIELVDSNGLDAYQWDAECTNCDFSTPFDFSSALLRREVEKHINRNIRLGKYGNVKPKKRWFKNRRKH
jgi:hypothetical protein